MPFSNVEIIKEGIIDNFYPSQKGAYTRMLSSKKASNGEVFKCDTLLYFARP
ncbi:MAG: hypothetical protein AAF849_18915 [Bacteroidota bacterium]